MSKELTEQWRNGELFGFHYVKEPKEKPKIHNASCMDYLLDKCWVEVLAPVPTYDQFVELTEKADQFSQLVKKVEGLESRLREAEMYLRIVYRSEACYTEAIGGYLEKYGVEK